jgi:uncharacterized protein (TIGR02996 family)
VSPTRSDDVGFLLACTAAHWDALPRLTWADYLDETDRPAAAAYLREDRGAILITAAHEQLLGGTDPRQVADVVLWIAGGWMDTITAGAVALTRGVQAAAVVMTQMFARVVRLLGTMNSPTAQEPAAKGE